MNFNTATCRKRLVIIPIAIALAITYCIYVKAMASYRYTKMEKIKVRSSLPIRSKQYLQSFWQEFKYLEHTFYANQFYFDDRVKHNGNNKVVGFVSGPPLNDKEMVLWCLLWTKEDTGKYSVKSSIAKVENIVKTIFKYHEVQYDPYVVSCTVPANSSAPEYVTLVDYIDATSSYAIQTVSNLLKVVIPNKNVEAVNNTKRIGICTHGMHGEVTDDEIPLLVQWFELSKMFGAAQITLYNVSLSKQSKYFDKLVEYYIDNGFLEFINFPGIPPTQRNEDPLISRQLIVRHTLGDCFYRYLYTNWYTLHLDTDEIAVPRTCDTYAECITNFLKKHPGEGERRPGLSVKRNYHYYNVAKYELPEISKNFPVLKYPMRTNDTLDYLGKSFLNPRECDFAWEHRCFSTNVIVDINTKDMLVQHYRNGCEVALKRMCSWKNPIHVRDTFLQNNYEDEIIKRTQKVLKAISWTKDMDLSLMDKALNLVKNQ